MPLHWQPVGPHAASTYWRRRAVVLVAALAVLAVAALPLRGDDDVLRPTDERGSATPTAGPTADPSGAPAADPTADPSASPTPSADPADVEPCEDADLEVSAEADASEYPPGATAALTLTVRNTGTEPCRRALGQGAVELLVTSGEDRIWSSDDCAPGGPEGVEVLAPDQTSTARASWATVRSAPGCPPDQAAAQPGTYRLTARVGELRVPGAVLQLTG